MASTSNGFIRKLVQAKPTVQPERGDMDIIVTTNLQTADASCNTNSPEINPRLGRTENIGSIQEGVSVSRHYNHSVYPRDLHTQKDTGITSRAHHNTTEVKDRFWNETSTPTIPPSPAPIKSNKKSTSPNWNTGKPSIAAATIIGILVLAAICFLSFYYIRRERARRLRRLQEQNSSRDPFGQSSLSLNAETSKTLDDFLMKDVQPERASLMFSRSRSPSISFLVDETERARSNRNSFHASGASLLKAESLARVSNDRTRWSPRGSEHSYSSLKESQYMLQPGGSFSPFPSKSSTSTVPTSPRSSLLWSASATETTPATTEGSSLQSQDVISLRSSASVSLGSNLPSSESSLVLFPSNASRSSNASSRLSAHSIVRSDPRAINGPGGLRRSHARSGSQSLSQSIISPIPESLDGSSVVGSSDHLPSFRSTTPSPLFRLSDS